MTKAQVKKLHKGDEVHWTDPDEGKCSRTLTIQSVTIHGDVVVIQDKDGDVLECWPRELR